MHSSKLIKIFSIFSNEELQLFERFLASPFFFEKLPSREIILLFNHIRTCLLEQKEEALTKEHTFKVIFHSDTFVKGKLEKLMSTLLKAIEKFIIYHFSSAESDKVQQKLTLAKVYRERKLNHLFELTIKQLNKIQNNIDRRNRDFYYHQFLIEKEVAEFESFYNTRNKDLNMPNTLESLDTYYLITRMEYASWLFSQAKHHTSINLQDSDLIFEHLAPIYESAPYSEVPLIKVYSQVYLFLQQDEGAFSVFQELLERYEDELPLSQLRDLQALCRSYCIQNYNRGEEKYLHEAFRLYKLHLEKGYLYYDGECLTPSAFGNLVSLGVKLEAFDWVNHFLEKFKDRITRTDKPEEIYNFNLAQYYFAIRDYESTLDRLSVNYEDLYYKMAAKRLELKVYYENQSEILESRMDAFKILTFRLSKNMLSANHRRGNNNFIDLLKQIINPKTRGNQPRIEKLIQKVINKKVIAEKEWLLDILEEMNA